jgi:carboxylesterase type B
MLTFNSGHYFKGLESVISSHVKNEGGMFTDSTVTDDQKFDAMLQRAYGNQSALASARDQLKKFFPPVSGAGSPYKTEHDRLAHYVTEMSFTCHNRLLADAYRGRVYSVQYAVPPATHGSDQTGTFFNPLNPQYANISKEELAKRQGFQSYLVSFAVTGNPNKLRNNATTIEWPLTTGFNDTTISNVLNVESLSGAAGMKLISDPLQVKDRCAVWTEIQKTVQKTLNY